MIGSLQEAVKYLTVMVGEDGELNDWLHERTRQELKLEPDADVDDNNLYWSSFTGLLNNVLAQVIVGNTYFKDTASK